MAHLIRVGVGGWSFEPWDETFYPKGLSKAKQLGYMAARMTAVEVNATFYSSFKPETFAKWRDETPPGFVFALKSHRSTTVRKTKEDMQASTQIFLDQGIAELGAKLGPINWQFPATRKFDPDYFGAFLSVLPRERHGLQLRHALEVRGEGFDTPAFYDLLRKHQAGLVYAEDDDYPRLHHEEAPFVFARLMQSQGEEREGYSRKEVDRVARLLTGWAKGRDVFAFFIAGAKENNPAAAMALQGKLGIAPKIESSAPASVAKQAPGAQLKRAAPGTAAKTSRPAPAKKPPARKK